MEIPEDQEEEEKERREEKRRDKGREEERQPVFKESGQTNRQTGNKAGW